MATQAKPYITPEEYLERERAAETRSEYYQGEMFAMAGTSRAHSLIISNLVAELVGQLRRQGCEVHSGNLRLLLNATGLYTYPDVMVICDKPVLTDAHLDTVTNPVLIIEVLSKSTQDYDLGGKFHQYMRIPSFQEYLTVSQKEKLINYSLRQSDGSWLVREIEPAAGAVALKSVSAQLSFDQIYAGVELTPK